MHQLHEVVDLRSVFAPNLFELYVHLFDQLVKHGLGITGRFGGVPTLLLYLELNFLQFWTIRWPHRLPFLCLLRLLPVLLGLLFTVIGNKVSLLLDR